MAKYIDPMQYWATEIAAKKLDVEAEEQASQQRKEQTAKRRTERKETGGLSLMDAFNDAVTIEELLIESSYKQCGDSWCSPYSSSGSYAGSIKNNRYCTLSSSDPLYTNGEGAHDAFSVFTILKHGGDQNAALKDAGDNWLAIDGVSWNECRQREYAKNKDNGNGNATKEPKDKKPFSLAQFSLKGHSTKMREKMLNAVFVLKDIALLGQATAIYAQFNTGKTLLVLWLLIDSIRAGRINAEDVFYINADDTYGGLVIKNELAEQYGFHMLAPNENDFSPDSLLDYLKLMIDEGSARGKIIILDTLKKFADLMNKEKGSKFMVRVREFVQAGGTLIMLAHTNKNKNAAGEVVYGGTNDIPSDTDCVFTLDTLSDEGGMKKVIFHNIKSREGDIAKEKVFSYQSKAETYTELLDSVLPLGDDETNHAKHGAEANKQRENDQHIIDAITDELEQQDMLKTDLISSVHENTGISRAKTTEVLSRYTGASISDGDLWHIIPGDKNAKVYSLLKLRDYTQTTANDYRGSKRDMKSEKQGCM